MATAKTGATPAKKKATRAKPRRAKAASAGPRLRVKQVRSGIGHPDTMRRTLASLGLRHHQQTIEVSDTPSIRGMLYKVRHLVQVTPVAEA